MGRWSPGRLLVAGVAGILAVLGTADAILLGNSEPFRLTIREGGGA